MIPLPRRLLCAIGLLLAAASLVRAEPVPPNALRAPTPPAALYLTWQRNPAHTMTVHWHTVWRDGFRDSVLEYRPAGTPETATGWVRATGSSQPMSFTDRMVHTVEISALAADTTYEFRLGWLISAIGPEFDFVPDGPVHRFRTLPATLSRPVRFASGGDAYSKSPEVFAAMNRVAARQDPDFALMGGDIAYANGNPEAVGEWFEFFRIWTETMVTADGRLIPIIPAIGNHEVHGDAFNVRGEPGRGLSPERAPEFYSVFSFPGRPGYNVLDFGDYLSVIALDSAHTNPVDGAQTDWLRGVLAARRAVPFIVPFYHVGAYPSVRSLSGSVAIAIRANWVPLFDEAGLRFVFENHDHAFKVTHPLRAGQINPAGVRYLGDGAWAVKPRDPQPLEKTPYIERSQSRNHLFFVTLHPGRADFLAIDPRGEVFDRFGIESSR